MSAADRDTIVVGLDSSEESSWALDLAIAEAARCGRRLLLAHVWQWQSDAIGSVGSMVSAPDSRQVGRNLLERGAARAKRSGVQVRTRLLEGPPSTALAEASEGAAMLMVGARDRSGLTKALLGSVSRGCIQKCRCPVLVVSHPAFGESPSGESTDGGAARPDQAHGRTEASKPG